MLGAEGPLVDGEGALEERLGLGVAAGNMVDLTQVVEQGGEVGILAAEARSRMASARWCSGSASA